MSHTVEVKMISDQEIEMCGETINIHDIKSIQVNNKGVICGFTKLNDEKEIVWFGESE